MYHTIRKFVFSDSQCLGGESRKSFEELFEKLDVNKDGKVDVSELKTGLAAMGFSMGKGEAQVNPVQLCISFCWIAFNILQRRICVQRAINHIKCSFQTLQCWTLPTKQNPPSVFHIA